MSLGLETFYARFLLQSFHSRSCEIETRGSHPANTSEGKAFVVQRCPQNDLIRDSHFLFNSYFCLKIGVLLFAE